MNLNRLRLDSTFPALASLDQDDSHQHNKGANPIIRWQSKNIAIQFEDKYYKDMKDETLHKDVSRVEKDIKDKSSKIKKHLQSQRHSKTDFTKSKAPKTPSWRQRHWRWMGHFPDVPILRNLLLIFITVLAQHPIFHWMKSKVLFSLFLFFLGLTITFSEVDDSASLDDNQAKEARESTPSPTSMPTVNSFSKCQHSILLLPL